MIFRPVVIINSSLFQQIGQNANRPIETQKVTLKLTPNAIATPISKSTSSASASTPISKPIANPIPLSTPIAVPIAIDKQQHQEENLSVYTDEVIIGNEPLYAVKAA